jgi:hypothetical protein
VSKLAPQSCTRACRNGAEWAKDQKVDFHLQLGEKYYPAVDEGSGLSAFSPKLLQKS